MPITYKTAPPEGGCPSNKHWAFKDMEVVVTTCHTTKQTGLLGLMESSTSAETITPHL